MSPNGDLYEGEYLNGQRHGKAKLTMSDAFFEGQFINNEMVEGEYKWKDGRRYKG